MPEFLLGALYQTFLCVRFTFLFFFFVAVGFSENNNKKKG